MAPSRTESVPDGVVDKSTLKIVAAASPADGHTNPMLRIVDELVLRGYDVTFLAGDAYKDAVTAIGAHHVSVPPYDDMPGIVAELAAIPDRGERLARAMVRLFIEPTAERMAALYAALERVRREHPARRVVLLTESFFLGHDPLLLGAPPPRGFATRPRAVNVNACSYALTSVDTAPFGLHVVPGGDDGGGGSSPESRRAAYRKMRAELLAGPLGAAAALQERTLAALGATDLGGVRGRPPFDVITTTADVTLQMCPPSVEYPVSDVHPKVRFVGALPPRVGGGGRRGSDGFAAPGFWDAVVTRGERPVVVVSQGTVAVRHDELLVPAMRALADREDVVVVAILGSRGARLPDEVVVPANCHVVDYLAYDRVLPHAAVFVLNAGYGGFMHGVVNGVPMVLAGGSEEKPEVANRAEFAGVGVNLRTGTPSQEQIRDAVDEVLSNPRYAKRVKQIQQENEQMRAIDAVEEEILKWAAVD